MQRPRRSYKVYREEVKERLTTHWDLDYMDTAELEAVMGAHRDPEKREAGLTPGATGGFSGWIKAMLSSR